ncbi:MAG TPA: cupredoxin domain-containing protein [Verrucomicrobiae bacterium]|nr:cupredoxin domain-containing protein [Verrucomicrobiae bacterium]
MKRLLLTIGLVALVAISAACSSTAAEPVPSGPIDPNGPTIVAKNLAFTTTTVEIAAGKNVTLHFDNQDSAPHNVAIYQDSSASKKISVGQIITSAKSDQVVPALAAGTYFFRCDVHTNMTGTIVVK